MFENLIKRIQHIFGRKEEPKNQGIDNSVGKAEEQIRLLKTDLIESLKHLAEVKAIYIRMRKENEIEANRAKEYENKARLLLQRASEGVLGTVEADNLALQALGKRDEILKKISKSESNLENQKNVVSRMEDSTRKLKEQIGEWEMELKSLKARAKISEANRKLNQRLSGLDSQNTSALLQDMRDKVNEQEFLAEAYQDTSNYKSSLDEEIDKILGLEDDQNKLSLDKLKAEENQKKILSPEQLQLRAELDKLKKELED